MKTSRNRWVAVAVTVVGLLIGGIGTTLHATPIFSLVADGGVTNDLFDIKNGTVVNGGNVDRANAEAVIGPSVGYYGNTLYPPSSPPGHYFDFRTRREVTVTGIRIAGFGQDDRKVTGYILRSGTDQLSYPTILSAETNIPSEYWSRGSVTDTVANASAARFYRLEIYNSASSLYGPRVDELDGFGDAGLASSERWVDANLLNATDTTPSGLSTNFTSSTVINSDHNARNAFIPGGGVVIFADGGTADNGNQILGDGGERVDFITWETVEPVTIAGYQVDVSGPDRFVQLVQFSVDNVVRDFFDNNGVSRVVFRPFADGPVKGRQFKIEITRHSNGPRIVQIDAVLAPTIPPKGTLIMFK